MPQPLSAGSRRTFLSRGICLILLLFTAWLAYAVLQQDTAAFDRAVLLWFRMPGDPSRLVGPRWLGEVARDVTSLGSTVVLWSLVIVTATCLALAGWLRHGLLVLGVSIIGQFTSTLSKHSFARIRPSLVPNAPEVFTASFPSGHALLSAAVYLTLAGLLASHTQRKSLKLFYLAVGIVVTVVICVSRVALGVHWPSDVVAGWCIGVIYALSAGEIADRWASHDHEE